MKTSKNIMNSISILLFYSLITLINCSPEIDFDSKPQSGPVELGALLKSDANSITDIKWIHGNEAIFADYHGISALNVETGEERMLSPGPIQAFSTISNGNITRFIQSANGKFIYFKIYEANTDDDRRPLFRVDIAGGPPAKILDSLHNSPFMVSDDGNYVGYKKSETGKIFVHDVQNQSEDSIMSSGFPVAFSPDLKRLLIADGRYAPVNYEILNLLDNTYQELDVSNIAAIHWTSDSLFVVEELFDTTGDEIFIKEIFSNSERLVWRNTEFNNNDGRINKSSIAYSKDLSLLAYSRNKYAGIFSTKTVSSKLMLSDLKQQIYNYRVALANNDISMISIAPDNSMIIYMLKFSSVNSRLFKVIL